MNFPNNPSKITTTKPVSTLMLYWGSKSCKIQNPNYQFLFFPTYSREPNGKIARKVLPYSITETEQYPLKRSIIRGDPHTFFPLNPQNSISVSESNFSLSSPFLYYIYTRWLKVSEAKYYYAPKRSNHTQKHE